MDESSTACRRIRLIRGVVKVSAWGVGRLTRLLVLVVVRKAVRSLVFPMLRERLGAIMRLRVFLILWPQRHFAAPLALGSEGRIRPRGCRAAHIKYASSRRCGRFAHFRTITPL